MALKLISLKQNDRRFADGILKYIFWVSIKLTLTFVPNSPIDNNPALV